MSIYIAESFDGVATASQLDGNVVPGQRWGRFDTIGSISSTNPRTGNNLEATASTFSPAFSLGGTTFNDVNAQNKEVYVGMAIRVPSLPAADRGLMGVSGSDAAVLNHIRITSNGALSAYRSGSDLLAGSANGVITATVWHYVEFYLKRSDSGGRFVVRVDDLIVIDFTGDTFATTGTNNPYLRLGKQGTGIDAHTGTKYDDLYVVSVDGVGHNGFVGTCYVPCLRPNGNGVTNQWVGSDGNSTDNYLLIDEQSLTDSDYIEATNNGDRDMHTYEDYDVPVGQTILSVQQNARAAYLSTARDLGFVARLQDGTTDVQELALTNSLAWKWKNRETKPGGGNWSEDDYNNAQFGVEQAAV